MDKNSIIDEINLKFNEEEKEVIENIAELNDVGEYDISSLTGVISKIQKQEEQLDSEKHNIQMNQFRSDIKRLYIYLNSLDSRVDDNIKLNNEIISKLKNRVQNIKNRLKELKVKAEEDYNQVYIENFENNQGFEQYNNQNLKLFSERKIKGQKPYIFNKEEICENNKYADFITLKNLENIEPQNISVETIEQTGRNLSSKKTESNLENVITQNTDKVWEENIFSNKQFSIQLDQNDLENNIGFYGTNHGALFKIRMTFDSTIPLNNLTFVPHSEYPMKLISIRSFESTKEMLTNNPNMILAPEKTQIEIDVDNLDIIDDIENVEKLKNWIKILGYKTINGYNIEKIRKEAEKKPGGNDYSLEVIKINEYLHKMNVKNKNLTSQYIDKTKKFQFSPIKSKIVEFCVQQEHYEKTKQLKTKIEDSKIKIMQELFKEKEEETSISSSKHINNVIDLDKNNKNNMFSYINKKIKQIKDSMTNNSLYINFIEKIKQAVIRNIPKINDNAFDSIKTKEKVKDKGKNRKKFNTKNKLKYQYGAKEIIPNYQAFYNESIFVSDLYNINCNAKRVKLETNDVNRVNQFNEPLTTIEYYITNKKDPNYDEWYPIIPENYKEKNQTIYGKKYKNWIVGEKLQPYEGSSDHFKAELRFKATGGNERIEVYKNGDKIDDSKVLFNNNDDYIEEVYIADESYEPNSSDIFYINYELAEENSAYMVDFEEECTPETYINKDGSPGEVFNGTDINNSIELEYYPYINYGKIFSFKNHVGVKTDEDDNRLYPFNPYLSEYNPNNDQGYVPIKVSINGSFDIATSEGNIINVDYKANSIKQDRIGAPYEIKKENGKIDPSDTNWTLKETKEVDLGYGDKKSQIDILTRLDEAPYISNKTKYTKDELSSPGEYSPINYPVIDYVQNEKEITFGDYYKDNKIRVEYQYLVEGVRVKAIMRNLSKNSGYTPEVDDYTLKIKEF